MSARDPPGELVRFGLFEVDLRSRELRKNGFRLRIQDKPFELLSALLQAPGTLLTRVELRERLWPGDESGDFEHELSVAVQKLRRALGDTAANPRFIETLPRRGYRFLAPVRESAATRRGGRMLVALAGNYFLTTLAIWVGHWASHAWHPLHIAHVLGHHRLYAGSAGLRGDRTFAAPQRAVPGWAVRTECASDGMELPTPGSRPRSG